VALKHLELALEHDSDNDAALMAMGSCLLRLDRPEDAADCFRRILAHGDDSPYVHHNLGVCECAVGRHEQGLKHFKQAMVIKPGFAMAMHKAAIANIRLARWRDAREMIRKARESAPESEALAQLSKRLWRIRLAHWFRWIIHPINALRGR
jgi:tetratricopeptide (TPR) repeat protein